MNQSKTAGHRPRWILLILGLPFLFLPQSPNNGQKNLGSGRLGDLQITVNFIRLASESDTQQYGLSSRRGYESVLVFITFRDAANYKNCTFPEFWLKVKEGYEYQSGVAFKLKSPDTSRLLPTDESSGGFVFAIKDGTEPAALKVVRDGLVDSICAEGQHRETRPSGPDILTFTVQRGPNSRQ